jgi:hypothetical protein
MEIEKPNEESVTEQSTTKSVINFSRIAWNAMIVVMVFIIGYFSYAFFSHKFGTSKPIKEIDKPARVIQLDVLNGCGAKGVSVKFTNYLRANGFDVVEMKNYKTFHVPQTLVVDRVGNLESARLVAATLGVDSKKVIQQINMDYFVDVSVIIGEDYSTLLPSQ